MLGELYKPSGLARETAQQVLEVEEPYAVNVAYGCSNGCLYCYGPNFSYQTRENWMRMRFPKYPPVDLVLNQLKKIKPDGVFISFMTDPYHSLNKKTTSDLIDLLLHNNVRIATLSKLDVPSQKKVRCGMTIVSLDEAFWHKFESNTINVAGRIHALKDYKDLNNYVWVSMEPNPISAIWKQDFKSLLEELKFVDFIVFGKWNYDRRANTEEAKIEYKNQVGILIDFCKSNHVRFHIKSDTLRFIKEVM